MKLNLTFADVPLEIGMVQDFANLVARSEDRLKEEARKHVWHDLDEADDIDRQIGGHLEELIRRGVALRFLSVASLVAAWAVYEATLTRVANHLRRKRECVLKLSQLRGDFLTKARMYFDDVLGVDMHPPGTDWERLTAIAEVRHAFAHGNGRLIDVKQSRRTYIKRLVAATDGVDLDTDGYIIISSSYARDAADFIQMCLTELVERVAPVVESVNGT